VAESAGPSSTAVARIFLTVVALAVGLYLLYLVRSVVGLAAISLFLAIALGPGVDFFTRRGLGRAKAILLTYLCIGLGVVGVGLLVVPPIVTQVDAFARHLPQYVDDAQKNKTIQRYDKRYHITEKLKEQAQKVPSRLGKAAGALQDVTVGVFTAAVKLATVLTLTFFLLLEGQAIFDFLARLFGPRREEHVRTVSGDVYRAVAGYVAGNLVISVIAGLVTYLTLAFLGVPFAVPLAVLMAFLDLIPLVGATIGGVAIGLVTLFSDFPTSTIVWVVVFVLYQQVENNVIQPVVYRRTVNVHPLIVIVAILIGSNLLGVLGALVAIPVAATIQIIALDAWGRRGARVHAAAEGDGPDPPPAPPGSGPALAMP
jgi:predicted PurR-regulated permease PerM